MVRQLEVKCFKSWLYNNSVTLKNTVDIVVTPLMGCFFGQNLFCGFIDLVYSKEGHDTRLLQWYLARIMECLTFVVDLSYERIHIAWARYGANLIIF